MDVMIPEQIVQNSDGTYTIFINSRHSYASQLESYKHAMDHIKNGDFEKNDVQQIESEAHNLPGVQQEERISSVDFEERLRELRKNRAKTKRKLHEHEKKMRWSYETDPERYARRIENQRLYGDDL